MASKLTCVEQCPTDPTNFGLLGFVFESTLTSSFIFGILVARLLNLVTETVFSPIGYACSASGDKRRFSDFFYSFNGTDYSSLQAAALAGAAVFPYGYFIQTLVEIVCTAVFLYMISKVHRRWYAKRNFKPE